VTFRPFRLFLLGNAAFLRLFGVSSLPTAKVGTVTFLFFLSYILTYFLYIFLLYILMNKKTTGPGRGRLDKPMGVWYNRFVVEVSCSQRLTENASHIRQRPETIRSDAKRYTTTAQAITCSFYTLTHYVRTF
jgi:hypothetical protein